MAQSSSCGPPLPSYPIISPQFCAPYPVDLSIARLVKSMKDGEFVVANMDGNILFKVKGSSFFSMHQSRVLVDVAGSPIVTLREKIMSAHEKWHAFRGESTDMKDLLFTVKRSSVFQRKIELDVFFANNTEEKVCDFKIKGSWSERSCIVYAGESSTIVAQMHKHTTTESVLIGKDNFMVTVCPNVDYGFIVALIIILTAINDPQLTGGAAVTAGAAEGSIGAIIGGFIG